MILTITKNKNNQLELKHSNHSILTCNILPDNTLLKPSLFETKGPSNPYSSIIQKIRNDMFGAVKLIINRDLIEKHSKEIMLMLSSINIINPWDKKFWSKINNSYTPIIKTIKEYLSSLQYRML